MTPSATKKRTLSTAEERREAVLEAAMHVYAARGLHGTPTLDVAKAAGISQAYLFRLFPTKSDLTMAVVQRCSDRILETFRSAAAQAKASGSEEVLEAMGERYAPLMLEHPEVLMVLMHAIVASHDEPAVRAATRRCFERLVELVQRESGAPEEDVQRFFAHGMLINVMASIGAQDVDARWAQLLTFRDHDR